MEAKIAETVVKDKLQKLTGNATEKEDAKWYDFNYPPGIRLIHFSVVDCGEEAAPAAKFLHANFLAWT